MESIQGITIHLKKIYLRLSSVNITGHLPDATGRLLGATGKLNAGRTLPVNT